MFPAQTISRKGSDYWGLPRRLGIAPTTEVLPRLLKIAPTTEDCPNDLGKCNNLASKSLEKHLTPWAVFAPCSSHPSPTGSGQNAGPPSSGDGPSSVMGDVVAFWSQGGAQKRQDGELNKLWMDFGSPEGWGGVCGVVGARREN